MDPLRIYDYLITTRERVFDAVRPLPPEQHQRRFDIGLKTIASTLTHLMVPPYDQWPIKYEAPPPFAVIEKTWRDQSKRIRGVVAAERDWNRKITWLSFPDDTRGNKRFHITCTAGDLFTQLALHEVHHRAQIMAMLRELGPPTMPLEDLDYNALMFERLEAR
jgi:uncharacterized damage-inducible protein DinB